MKSHAEPQRTCVGCRSKAAKRELIRLVRQPDGTVRFDSGGRSPGRGAYLHPAPSCLVRATRDGALARAVRSSLSREEVVRLVGEVRKVRGE